MVGEAPTPTGAARKDASPAAMHPIPTICWTVSLALIGVASLVPPGSPAERLFGINAHTVFGLELGHVVAYAMLTAFAFWALADFTTPVRVACVLLSAAGLGAAFELLQPAVGRSLSWNDLLADMVGVVLAVLMLCAGSTVVRRASGRRSA